MEHPPQLGKNDDLVRDDNNAAVDDGTKHLWLLLIPATEILSRAENYPFSFWLKFIEIALKTNAK